MTAVLLTHVMARMWHIGGHPRPCRDLFRVRERCRSRLLSYLDSDLLRVVRTRPLVSAHVSVDRYSVGYSVVREHVASALRREDFDG